MQGLLDSTGGAITLLSGPGGAVNIEGKGRVIAGTTGRVSIQTDTLTNTGTIVGGLLEVAPATIGATAVLGPATGLLSSLAHIGPTTVRIGAVTLPGDTTPTTTAGAIQVNGAFGLATTALELDAAAAACSDSASLLAGLPPLPSAVRELDAARQILGGAPSDELLNAAFTADAVQHADLRDYRIMHFATHALLPAELQCEDEPAIVTSTPAGARDASGALLTASEIVGLHLDANLVILSACNSGGPGGQTAGESLSGLARAFFYAGARSLLVTHWSVNDQAAAYLVVDTLNRLHKSPGLGVAAAMQGAELAMLDAAGHDMPAEIAHPFFWAPFAVICSGSGSTHIATAAR